MAVITATVRLRPSPGPALQRGRVPISGLAVSLGLHVVLVAAILISSYVWHTTQPKAYVVNLVPAIAAVGSPQGRTRAPEPTPPTPPRVEEQRPTPPPALPERETTKAPERTASRPTELPDRPAPPRENLALPDRSLPTRTPAPALRAGEKELPRVASAPPTPTASGSATKSAALPPPPPPRGLPTGSPQGVGAVTLNASDFPFAWYLRQVQRKISEKWDGQAREGTQPQVVFDIGRDGRVSGLRVEKTSGNPLYDQAALRAITEAAPLPPLPDDFKDSSLKVHLGFNYSGTRG
jgi:colicin import membrane protein